MGALALFTPSAHAAGTYTVKTCDPDVGIVSTSGWSPQAAGVGVATVQSCGSPGGAMHAAFATAPGSYAGWRFLAPADTEIAAFSLVRAFALPANQPYGTGVYSVQTVGKAGVGFVRSHANFAGIFYSGFEVESAGGLNGQNELVVRIDCGGGGACSGVGDAGLAVRAGAITLRDDHTPVITTASGALLGGAPVSGSVALAYGATDRGGGVYRAILTVDGVPRVDRVVDAKGGTCVTGRFTADVPCKLSVSDKISLDTRVLSEGVHSAELIVRDATDANQATYGPFKFTVDNVPAPANVRAPRVSGTARHGEVLSGDDGAWSGAGLSLRRQWERFDGSAGGWVEIGGATAATYAVTTADHGKSVRLRVTASNSEGSASAVSEPFGPIVGPDVPGDVVFDGLPGGLPTGGRPVEAGGDGPVLRTETQNGRGPVATATLTAAFAGSTLKVVTARWGAKRKIHGTLRGRDGQPIVGARLDVTSRPELMGDAETPLGHVATDTHGRFEFKLPAGVSRTIRFAYKRILEADTYAQTADVTVRVVPKVTMRTDRAVLRNGQAVRFRGSVAGAPMGSRKIVELQAFDGGRWRIFASTRLARGGNTFKHRYRFTSTFRPTVYRFRAIVRTERGWPFTTGQTKPLKVKVRP